MKLNHDHLFIVGLMLISFGIAFIYWPASPIFLGGACVFIAWQLARTATPPEPTAPIAD
jgi:hypothetical protein